MNKLWVAESGHENEQVSVSYPHDYDIYLSIVFHSDFLCVNVLFLFVEIFR